MARKLLDYNQLRERGISFTRQHLGRLEAARKFPKRVRIGSGPNGKVAWVESEIDDHIKALAESR